MKTNAPEKIYLLKSQNRMLDGWYNELPSPKTFEQVEYIRADAFIEKAVKWLEEHKEAIAVLGFISDYYIEDFKKYIGE